MLREAIGLWDDPLPEMADEPVVVEAVGRWHGLLGAAVEEAADLQLRAGDAAAAEQLLSPHLSAFPLREQMARSRRSRCTGRGGRPTRSGSSIVPVPFSPTLRDSISGASSRPSSARCSITRPPSIPEPWSFTSSLFGRDDELATLQRVAARLGEQRGGVVTVTGPSGIGKTALVEELTGALERQGTSVAWARCPEGAAVQPFWPLAKVGLLDADAATASDPFARQRAAACA